MKNKQFRKLTRLLHVLAGVSFPLLVYSPLRTDATFLLVNQVLLVPAVVVTGLALWQQPRVLKWLRGNPRSV